MRLFLLSPTRPRWPYEVVSYDKEHHSALLRSREQVFTDPHFYLHELKAIGYVLTSEVPDCFKE